MALVCTAVIILVMVISDSIKNRSAEPDYYSEVSGPSGSEGEVAPVTSEEYVTEEPFSEEITEEITKEPDTEEITGETTEEVTEEEPAAFAGYGKGLDEASPEVIEKAKDALDNMSTEDKVAQMFIISLDSLSATTNTNAAGDITRAAYKKFPAGGVILFSQNIKDRVSLKELTKNLQSISKTYAGVPLIIATDEEGGEITRIASKKSFGNLEDVDTMYDIGMTEDVSNARHAGETIGTYLSEYGVNMDLAPVADLVSDPDGNPIGRRSFGGDPEEVSLMVDAYREGLESCGVQSCIKHYLGLGSVYEDTHKELAVTDKTKDELMKSDLYPFMYEVGEGARCIMTAHIAVPEVTGNDDPASLSEEAVQGILRDEMGFTGVIITDDLKMGAISAGYSDEEAAVRAVQAGNDMLMYVGSYKKAYNGVLNAVESGEISEDRIDESVMRILTLKYMMEESDED